jgi:hypothetical protein
MLSSLVEWPGEVDAVMAGDLTAAAAFITPAGGAVVTGVAPCGLNRRHDGMVGFTSSLGFGKKLERIVRDPRVALAYHSREHGFTESPRFVLVQGSATVDLQPSRERLDAFAPRPSAISARSSTDACGTGSCASTTPSGCSSMSG